MVQVTLTISFDVPDGENLEMATREALSGLLGHAAARVSTDQMAADGLTLGEWLKVEAGRRRFSQRALGIASGLSASYVDQIIRGKDRRSNKQHRPSPTTLDKLAKALSGGAEPDRTSVYHELMARAGYPL